MPSVLVVEGPAGPGLQNDLLVIRVHLDRGVLDLEEIPSGRTVIGDISTSVTLAGGPTFSSGGVGFVFDGAMPIRDVHGTGLVLRLRRERDESEPETLTTLTLYEQLPFAVIRVEIVNGGQAPIRIASFQVLDCAEVDLGSPMDGWRFYKHGWQSWSPTLALPCSGEDIAVGPPVIAPGTRPESQEGRFVSEMMTAIVAPAAGRSLIAGFVSTADQLSQVSLDREPRALTAVSYADGIEIPAGGSLSSEALLLLPAEEPLKAMEMYGDALAREMRAIPFESAASGWCSWYQYWHGVREEDVISNLEKLAATRRAMPVDYVQIDDGWQADIGDWLTVNDRFPRGLKQLVDEIHNEGFKAGLWLAPFVMGASSQLYGEHPEWAVQYRPGKPSIVLQNWGQDCYALDLTREEVIDWIARVFTTICEGWGFDYVKVDFIYAGAVDGLRQSANVTRAQAYRRGLEAIRRAVGDRFVLGCGNPMGPSIGLVDGSRIGPDVAPRWEPAPYAARPERHRMSEPSALNSIRNSITRFWMHGRLWMNDPDCLLARNAMSSLTLDEVHSLATVIAISGGMVLDSDDLTRLPEGRRRIVSMMLPPYGKAAHPLDLFKAETPSLLELDCGTHRMLAVFNWRDEAAIVEVPLPGSETHVFEVWSRRYLGRQTASMKLDIAAHGCALLRLTRVLDQPQVVGTSLHLMQGAMEIESEEWDGEQLRVRIKPVAIHDGELFVSGLAASGVRRRRVLLSGSAIEEVIF